MNKKTFLITAIVGLILVGGAGFGFYTMKMNAASFKGIGFQVKSVPDDISKKWADTFETVLADEEFLKTFVEESDYATKLDVPSGEAVSHLKDAAKARFVKRKGTIEVGVVGKRKQDESLKEIGKLLYEKASVQVAAKEPLFRQYLEDIQKAREQQKAAASE